MSTTTVEQYQATLLDWIDGRLRDIYKSPLAFGGTWMGVEATVLSYMDVREHILTGEYGAIHKWTMAVLSVRGTCVAPLSCQCEGLSRDETHAVFRQVMDLCLPNLQAA